MEAVIHLFERPPRLVRRAKYAPEFLEAMRGRKFRNPDSGNEVVFETLSEAEQKRIHDHWARVRQRATPPEKAKPKRNIPEEALKATHLISNQDPARYEGVDIEYGSLGEDPEEIKKELHAIVGDAAKKAGVTPEQFVTDLAGGGGLTGMLDSVQILTLDKKRIMVSGSGEQVHEMDREIFFDHEGGTPVQIHNKLLELSDDAPKGTGTRMLATQIGALKEAGGEIITTTGSGCFDCDYKGYYVWPLLGFEGKIPEDDVEQMPRSLHDELTDTSGGEPFHISDLMSFDEGRKWWLELGSELELEFHVDNDFVLQKYVEKKAELAGKTVGQFLHNASKKLRGKSQGSTDKVEQAPSLSKEDKRILGEIWDGLPKKRKGKTMTTKTSTQALVEFAQGNPAFRTELLGELVKEAKTDDFAIDEFSQHDMLRNLRGGDLIEIRYSPNPVHPQRVATRLVDSDFDPAIPGVLLRGMEGQETLADRGQGMPLLWEPGTGQPGLPVLELRLVQSQLRLAEEADVSNDLKKSDKAASISEEAGKIIKALGGVQHLAKMLGARNIETSERGVSFEWPNRQQKKGNKVTINLGPEKTYDVVFFNKTASGEEKIQDLHKIYVEKLAATFEKHTGWFLTV